MTQAAADHLTTLGSTSMRRRIRGWMMFDWANQPFYTLILTFVFGPYFATVATSYFMSTGLAENVADARAQSLWSVGQTMAGLFIAFTAPILGAFADNTGRRIPWIIAFSILYVGGTWALWWTIPDGSTLWMSLLAFGIAMIGAEYSLIFVSAMLPDLGDDHEVGRISGSGMALGYAGGVLSLFIMLLLFVEQDSGKTLIDLDPAFGLNPEMKEGTRFVGPFAALWYLLFMIPFFRRVKDTQKPKPGNARGALRELGRSILSIARRTSLAAYLASSMFYRDALNALYAFGGVYATLVLNWSITNIGVFGIIGAISAAFFTWIGGFADRRFGPKPVIRFNVLVLIAVTAVIVGMSRDSFFGIPLSEGSALPDIVFYILGATIGAAGGALQSASRSMMVRHTDPDRPTEAFGLYALSGKATAFLAPGLIGLVTWLTDSPRLGVSPVIGLFVLALILLKWVNPKGERTT